MIEWPVIDSQTRWASNIDTTDTEEQRKLSVESPSSIMSESFENRENVVFSAEIKHEYRH